MEKFGLICVIGFGLFLFYHFIGLLFRNGLVDTLLTPVYLAVVLLGALFKAIKNHFTK